MTHATSTAETVTWGFRWSPRELLAIAPGLREAPGDVALGARLFFAIGGHDEGPAYRRLVRTERGARMVRDGTPYPDLFRDYPALRALPAGTLGREYVRQLDERGIQPSEIDRLSSLAHEGYVFTPEHAYVRDRCRSAHDLYHTLTGYGIDLLGEGGVLAFTFAQSGNKGFGVLALMNTVTNVFAGRLDALKISWKGYRRGRRARYLTGVDDWDRLLRMPLADARQELELTPLESYRPLHLDEIMGRA